MTPDDFLRLSKAGLTPEQIALVMEIMTREASAAAAKEEERKAKGRERWHRWHNKREPNVSQREQTLANDSCEGVARGEDNLQTKKISGQEEKKDTSPPARSKRGERIPEDFSPDIDAAVSEGLSRPEAERQAHSFCDYWRAKPGKDGLKLDWQATWRVWYRRHLSSSPPPSRQSTDPPRRKPNAVDAYHAIAREKGWISDEPEFVPSTDDDAQRLSAVGSGPSGTVVDLRPGAYRRLGSGDV